MVNTLYLPELREMIATKDDDGLEEFCTALHPATTAEFMEGLSPTESWEVLSHADVATRAEIFSYFPREKQLEMLENLDRVEMGQLLVELAPDERVDMLDELDQQVVEELLPHVPTDERRDIQRLLSYPEGTAGAIMTSAVALLTENLTKAQALEKVREWSENAETIYYLYVVDEDNHLRGVLSFRELVFAANDQPVGELMERNIISISADSDQEEVAHKLAKFDLLAIPVVDTENRVVGIITHDDVLDVVREEAVADAQMSAGVQPLEEGYLETSLLAMTWKRGLWLTILFFSGLLTTSAMSNYSDITAAWPWLVIFIPLIMSCGGNSGNQSATLIITALTAGDVKLSDWQRIVHRELLMGLLLGGKLAFFGALAVLVYILAFPDVAHTSATLIIPLTLIGVVLCGTLTGSLLPLLFRRLDLDPALMSNPFVAVVMDMLGIVIYMSVAGGLLKLFGVAKVLPY